MLTTAASGTNSDEKEWHLAQIGPDAIVDDWDEVEPFVSKALEHSHGELKAEDVLELAKHAKVYVFRLMEGAYVRLVFVGEVIQYPQYKSFNIICIAGSGVRQLERFIPGLKQWLNANSILSVEGLVRPSIARLARRYGFFTAYVKVMSFLKDTRQ